MTRPLFPIVWLSRTILTVVLLMGPFSIVHTANPCGPICDETWTIAESPFVATCDVTVAAGCSLTIEAGVEVTFPFGAGLQIDGQLQLAGTASNPVELRSDNPEAGAGDWDGVQCKGNAICTMSHVEIEHALTSVLADDNSSLELSDAAVLEYNSGVLISGDSVANLTRVSTIGGNSGVAITGGTATVTDLTTIDNGSGLDISGGMIELEGIVSQMNGTGLNVYANSPTTIVAQHSEFSGNSLHGIKIWAAAGPSITVSNSSLHSNPQNIRATSGQGLVIHARGNWWGSADPAVIREGIIDGATSEYGPIVDWCDYLDGPGGSPVSASHCADARVCGETIVWDMTDKPYELLTEVVVCETGELQIGAGVEVKALGPASLIVEGTLSAVGTGEAEVRLGSTNPAAGPDAWSGIACVGNSVCTLEHVHISQATTALSGQDDTTLWITDVTADGNSTGIEVENGMATLTRVSATNGDSGVSIRGGVAALTDVYAGSNSGSGVQVNAGTAMLSGVSSWNNREGLSVQTASPTESPAVTVVESEFAENGTGVSVGRQDINWPDPFLSVTGSSLHSSTSSNYTAGSFLEADTVLDATGNWWGSSDPMIIRERISDRASSTGSAWVDWCGYLDGPDGAPAQAGHCAGGPVCGTVEVWDLVDKPYELLTDMFVCDTGELQIAPGVEVHGLAGRTEIIVEGTLTVSGEQDSEVLLTSADAQAFAGAWPGVRCQANAACSLAHAAIRQASIGVRGRDTATIDLSNVRVSDSEIGIALNGEAIGTLTRVSATDNTWGVLLENEMSVLTDVNATGNSESGVYITGSADLAGVVSTMNHTGLWVRTASDSPIVNVVQSEFAENIEFGVRVDRFAVFVPDPVVRLTASSLYGNGSANYSAGPFADPASVLWATDCWWGSTDLNVIRYRIFDHEDDSASPHVRFSAFGEDCEKALGTDTDGDTIGDFGDNCPLIPNPNQADGDGDGMGNVCDGDPRIAPESPCNGIDDELDGFLDADGDGWGDPCDFQPTRTDSNPGAPELCDARDNDGDGEFAVGELTDADTDGAISCGDCDDLAPAVNYCACESCSNLFDDDCDLLVDMLDSADCATNPYCIFLTTGPTLDLRVGKGTCTNGVVAAPVDVIRGSAAQLALVGSSVDLGQVDCVAGNHAVDRVTDVSLDSNPVCNDPLAFYLARQSTDVDYGQGSGGESRDVTDPDPACP